MEEAVPEVMPIEVSPTVAEGWTLTDTGISHYNDIIQKPEYYAREKGEHSRIISVSPDEALRMGAEAHGVPLAEELRIVDDAVVTRYANAMRVGKVMPLPVVDYVAKTQEGRHRILAAKEVGKTEIPLLVIEEAKPPAVKAEEPPIPKPYHEMTQREIISNYRKLYRRTPSLPEQSGMFKAHYRMIKEALREGKTVPANVLKDYPLKYYPDLAELVAKPPAVKAEVLPMSVIEYDYRYSLEELRRMAKAKGLSPSGSKKEIAARLIAKGVK